ncbi:MAG: 23S rRNA (adenine(2503)-C(2))-methyltransferase RlmN [Thiohalocapsa sp.]|jgi:23S rRNA (adenine2503-C2)-methyltransferase|uniref:23S rRNA (adenine(2503)-C(2))-methyltransferase RlmN n=1 Tax=Thiohalocapsa sp. TaxID=2497641 RepID=UPI0025D03AA7|nr:23S rRNA (adenine(2503)-C(2))-methyltransferase RlmN [Thiohalocapsa sp.]MCG6940742.1 23S rRNA (adenine(2503)-C(2))-methyltransferase RlmN [Thiohalocapsa sp.]
MAAHARLDLLNLDLRGCEALAQSLGCKPFHGRNLFKWVHKHGVDDFDAMTDLPKALRTQLAETVRIGKLAVAAEQPSADGTVKWLLELDDGQRVETVFIPEERRTTLCVSSQVGCALDCRFCATARQGFNRNLGTGEIVAQVRHAMQRLGKTPSNIVLMGMGEPLANFDAVVAATDVMRDDLAYMLSKYRVTLSTSGIVPNIYRLAEVSDISLAVSLHAPDNALRDELVPINRKYPLEELIPACRAYLRGDSRRRITWEYVMLDGVNDSIAQAKALIRLLEGTPSKVNLIPFNPFPGSGFDTTPPERVEAFRQRLLRAGLVATTRKTRGEEIAAACGQLVGRVQDRSRRLVAPPGPIVAGAKTPRGTAVQPARP